MARCDWKNCKLIVIDYVAIWRVRWCSRIIGEGDDFPTPHPSFYLTLDLTTISS